jgi:hypothetical protein
MGGGRERRGKKERKREVREARELAPQTQKPNSAYGAQCFCMSRHRGFMMEFHPGILSS